MAKIMNIAKFLQTSDDFALDLRILVMIVFLKYPVFVLSPYTGFEKPGF